MRPVTAPAVMIEDLPHGLNPLFVLLEKADPGFHKRSVSDPKAALAEPDFQIVKKLEIGRMETDGQVLGTVLRRCGRSHYQVLLHAVLAIRQAGTKLGDG
jgi:hypothetical protein